MYGKDFSPIDTFCQYLKSSLHASRIISPNSAIWLSNRHFRLNREAMTKRIYRD
jgi:hypothetical protein